MMLQIMILDSDVASDDVFRQSYWFGWCFQIIFFFFFLDSNDGRDDVYRQ